MRSRLCSLVLLLALAGIAGRASAAPLPKVDRIVVIVLENQEATSILTGDPAQSKTPLLRAIARHQRIAANYFGIRHPSEPNYVSMIGGDTFGFDSDAGSCFTRKIKLKCHKTDARNLVDDLESKHISWTALMQSMPSPGFLGGDYFFNTSYAEKHNPFIFFSNIAQNKERMSHIRPMSDPGSIKPVLANAANAPRFLYVVPDLCHDMHGATRCLEKDELYKNSDAYVAALIKNILAAPAFTDNSAIVVTFDEGTSDGGCCGLHSGGGRVATIVIKKRPGVFRSNVSYNHYSLLTTVETVWGLKLLGHTADRNRDGKLRFPPMLDLLSH
ncbi:MAG: alkaline phosphatase family protein [Candidatus Eremiobacteraeota bacterium]|nr:alkaline phosphatase family protein [Candidatus Eremiobacteraeota bacterium]